VRFYDSNVPIYASLDQDPSKKLVARRLLADAVLSGDVRISVQVLREYANCLFKKSRLTVTEIQGGLAMLRKIPVVRDSEDMLAHAVSVKAKYGIQFYDACIVAAAKAADCAEIYSEDLDDGQVYDGIRVVNPFAGCKKPKK